MTKKNIIIASASGIVVAIIVVLCLVCCGGKKNSYCSVIPNDAVTLVKVDAATFLQKHDIDLKPLVNMLGGSDATEKLQNCGLDFSKPTYLFYTDRGMAGAAMAVSNQESLIATLNDYGSLLGGKVSKKQDYQWMEFNDFIIVFDETKLLALSGAGMNARKTMLGLMKQDEDESVMSTTMYENLDKVDKPLAMVMSTVNMPEAELTQLASTLGATADEVKMDAVISFDIVDDKAILSLDINPLNNASQTFFDKFAAVYTPISGTFLESGISNPAYLAVMNLQGDKLWQVVSSMTGFSKMADELPLDKILPSFSGDVTVVGPNFNGDCLLMAEVKDKSALDVIKTLETWSEGHIKAVSVGPDAYCIGNGSDAIFLGIKDGTFYLATSQELSLLCGKEAETGVSKDAVDGALVYVTIDAQTLIGNNLNASEFAMFKSLAMMRLQKLDRLTLRAESSTHFELSLSVKDGKDFVSTMLK